MSRTLLGTGEIVYFWEYNVLSYILLGISAALVVKVIRWRSLLLLGRSAKLTKKYP